MTGVQTCALPISVVGDRLDALHTAEACVRRDGVDRASRDWRGRAVLEVWLGRFSDGFVVATSRPESTARCRVFVVLFVERFVARISMELRAHARGDRVSHGDGASTGAWSESRSGDAAGGDHVPLHVPGELRGRDDVHGVVCRFRLQASDQSVDLWNNLAVAAIERVASTSDSRTFRPQ